MTPEELQKVMQKAAKWDALEEKIGKCYFKYNDLTQEDEENDDPDIDLGTIGEIAAAAFGYL